MWCVYEHIFGLLPPSVSSSHHTHGTKRRNGDTHRSCLPRSAVNDNFPIIIAFAFQSRPTNNTSCLVITTT